MDRAESFIKAAIGALIAIGVSAYILISYAVNGEEGLVTSLVSVAVFIICLTLLVYLIKYLGKKSDNSKQNLYSSERSEDSEIKPSPYTKIFDVGENQSKGTMSATDWSSKKGLSDPAPNRSKSSRTYTTSSSSKNPLSNKREKDDDGITNFAHPLNPLNPISPINPNNQINLFDSDDKRDCGDASRRSYESYSSGRDDNGGGWGGSSDSGNSGGSDSGSCSSD